MLYFILELCTAKRKNLVYVKYTGIKSNIVLLPIDYTVKEHPVIWVVFDCIFVYKENQKQNCRSPP